MKNIDFPFEDFQFKSDSIFSSLPESELALLNKNMVTHSYKVGEILFREGGYPTGVFYIKSGKVKKYKKDKEGKEQIFYICTKEEILGYHALISDEKFTDTASTIEESEIAFIPKEDFLKAVQVSAVLSNRLLKVMSHEFSVLVNVLTVLSQKTVRQRVALSLIILRNKFKDDSHTDRPVEIDLSRDDLSKFVGTARETLIRLLHDFKEEDLIEVNGRAIIVKNALALSKIANIY